MLGEATTAKHSVKNVLVPGLKDMGVNLGSTAILTISGADTTAAAAQLASFTERWKTEGVDTVFLSGLQVSAQQFVPNLVKAMPGVQLIADNNTVGSYGQNLQKAGTRPNPYEGIIASRGPEREGLRPHRQLEDLRRDLRAGVPPDRPQPRERDPRPTGPHARRVGVDHRRLHRAHDVPRHR